MVNCSHPDISRGLDSSRRQSLLSPGASVDARLLRGSCQVFGTKFDLQSGEARTAV